jgi:hypothetical protein
MATPTLLVGTVSCHPHQAVIANILQGYADARTAVATYTSDAGVTYTTDVSIRTALPRALQPDRLMVGRRHCQRVLGRLGSCHWR